MAMYYSRLRGENDPTMEFTMEDRELLHEIAQTILNASMPRNSVVLIDICVELPDTGKPASIKLECDHPGVIDEYQRLVAQAIIDAFPIHGYASGCDDDTARIYKAIYRTPRVRTAQQKIDDLTQVTALLGEDHKLLEAISQNHTLH
jgi:hypothetical protein